MILDRLAPVLATIAAGVLLGLAVAALCTLSDWLRHRITNRLAAEQTENARRIAEAVKETGRPVLHVAPVDYLTARRARP